MRKHTLYYISLIGVVCLGLIGVLFSSQNHMLQLILLFTTIGAYVALAIFHHTLHHGLTRKIVLEYLLLAILGISVVLFVFAGAL